MINNLNIGTATVNDISHIVKFQIDMASETEGKNLDVEIVKNGVENLFHNPQYGFYIVAENEGKVVASLMITYEWSDWRNGLFWWIQSVFVIKEFRHQGVYKRMHEFIKNLAKSSNECRGLRLYVDKFNEKAIACYKRVGMVETAYLFYEELF